MRLKRGDSGQAVKELQRRLIQHGYDIQADGDFGGATDVVVRDFQKRAGVTVDGIVGDVTWAALGPQVPVRENSDLHLIALSPAFDGSNHGIRHTPPSVIVVHHSETKSADDTLRILRARGFSTHYEVDRDGKVREYLNPVQFVAWHCGGGINARSIGIDVTHYGSQDFPAAQVAALKALVALLCEQFGIPQVVAPDKYLGRDEHNRAHLLPGVGIYRHRNLASTVCPAGLPLEAVNG